MQAVAELVQQRLQLLEREPLPVEVGDQRGLRQAVVARGHIAEAPHGGMLELALARVDVDVQPGQRLASGGVAHRIGAHVGVPHRRLHRRVAYAEHVLGKAHHELDALLGREVGPERFLVDGVALAAHALGVERHVPALDFRRLQRRAQVLRLGLPQLGDVAQLALGEHGLHLVEEPLRVDGALGHATAQHEVGVALEAEQLRVFAPQLRDLAQQLEVGVAAQRRAGAPHALAGGALLGALQHGKVDRVVEAEQHVPFGVARRVLPHGLRHAGQLFRRERHLGRVVAQVLLELLAEVGDAVVDLLGAGTLVGRQADAGVLEALDGRLAVLAVDRVDRLHRARGAVQLLVLAHRRRELLPAQHAGLGGVADRLVRMDVLGQLDRVGNVLDVFVQVIRSRVPARVGRMALQRMQPGGGAGQAAVALSLQGLRVGEAGKGRPGQARSGGERGQGGEERGGQGKREGGSHRDSSRQ